MESWRKCIPADLNSKAAARFSYARKRFWVRFSSKAAIGPDIKIGRNACWESRDPKGSLFLPPRPCAATNEVEEDGGFKLLAEKQRTRA
jgi:hypothetical protein